MDKLPIRIEIKQPQETGSGKPESETCTKCSGLDQENSVLKRKLDEKDGIIRLLCKEIERRDEILDTSRKPIEEADVTVTFSEEGHPIYELKNKEKIPYTIKTEKLVPIILDNLIDSYLEKETRERDKSLCSKCKRVNENHLDDEQPSASKRPRLDSPLLSQNVKSESEINQDQSVQNEPAEKASIQNELAEDQSHQNKQIQSQSSQSKSHENIPIQSKSSEKQSNPSKPITKQSNPSKPITKQTSPSKSSEKQTKHKESAETTTHQSNETVPRKKIQSIQNESNVNSINCFSEIQDLSDCPVGQKFWCYDDSDSVSLSKYVIRLHDDRRILEPQDTLPKFTLFVKNGVFSIPRKFREPSFEMRRRVEGVLNKKLWLDIRDFDIFSQVFRDFFASIGPFITHLSIGYRLHSKREMNLNILLQFISDWMPNLEYLSINNNCLSSRWNFEDSDQQQPEYHEGFKTFEKLKTFRLITSNYTISSPQQFICEILKSAPNLENVYGLSLDFLRDNFEMMENVLKRIPLRSVLTIRALYANSKSNLNPNRVRYLDRDLSTLSRIYGLALEILDCRTHFVRDDYKTRSYSIKNFSKIIDMCKNSILKLTLDPISTLNTEILRFPTLPNLTHLQLDMSKRPQQELWTFFPPDFRISRKFPKLFTVELFVDYNTALEVSQSSRALIEPNLKYEISLPLSSVAIDIFKKHFPPSLLNNQNPFENVQSLILQNFTPWECIEGFSLAFQNIQVLQLSNNVEDVSTALTHCFKFFNKLTDLIIEVDKGTGNLDSRITGIHPNMFRNKSFHDPGKVQNIIRNNRARNSICDLSHLKLFKIIIRSNPNTKGQLDQVPVITTVSFIYGLELMKNKVTVEIDFEERMTSDDRKYIMTTLKPILPYVSINY